MPWYKMPNGCAVHINFGHAGNRKAPKACCKCGWFAGLLCDWKMPNGRDCDRPMCEAHAFEVGPDKHLCPPHVEAYREWVRDHGIPQQ